MAEKKKTEEIETQEKEFVLDKDALKSIAGEVVKGVTPVIEEKVDVAMETQKQAIENKIAKIEKLEKNVEKNLGKGKMPNVNLNKIEDEPKEVRFVKATIALRDSNFKALKEYNQLAMNARQKSGFGNETTNADGGFLVPDPDFEAEIEKLVPNYGVAFNEVSVVPVSGNAVKTNKRGSNVTMFETAEGAAKTGTKLVIEQSEVTLRKFAAIAPATDELVEDAAVDYWNEVTQGFAEERARVADQMVFTDTNATTPGILNTSGILVTSVGANITDLNWDNLLDAEAEVPTAAEQGSKWYMHKTVWNIVKQVKDDNSRYQAIPFGAQETPWGVPVVLPDILPNSSVVGDANEGYAVYGDLRRVKLYVKRGLVLTMLKEGTITDADSVSINLAEQDMTALRAVTRMVVLVKFPEAISVVGTGTVS